MNKTQTNECILILIIVIKCQVPSTLHTQLLEISRCTDVAKEKWGMEWAMGLGFRNGNSNVVSQTHAKKNICLYTGTNSNTVIMLI